MSIKKMLLDYSEPPKKVESPLPPGMNELYVKLISEEEAAEAGVFEGPERRAAFLVKALCTADGQRVFDDTDIEKVKRMPFKISLPLFLEASAFNGSYTEDDGSEGAGKNPATTPAGSLKCNS